MIARKWTREDSCDDAFGPHRALYQSLGGAQFELQICVPARNFRRQTRRASESSLEPDAALAAATYKNRISSEEEEVED